MSEGVNRYCILEAETLLAVSQILQFLPKRPATVFGHHTTTPLWYLRLNHTRLADAILDLCGIPQKEIIRRTCFLVFTRFLSVPPCSLASFNDASSSNTLQNADEKICRILSEGVQSQGLSQEAADVFRALVKDCRTSSGCVLANLDRIHLSLQKMRSTIRDQKRMRRFDDADKSLRSLKQFLKTMKDLGIEPVYGPKGFASMDEHKAHRRPLYVSLDLGLRQRRKHYHGGVYYQCIVLPNNYFDVPLNMDENHDSLVSPTGKGIKVAEGGNFSDLVRKHRPPGNFTSLLANHYAGTAIPVCAGVRLSIGKLVEIIYLDASFCVKREPENQAGGDAEEAVISLRRGLGFPFEYGKTVHCIVASMNGMEVETMRERFSVAARLWSEGVSAEYFPQSNVMLSLLKRVTNADDEGESASDWSLVELNGICSLLSIPFIVIVQPHLLRDKGSVRLRNVNTLGSADAIVSLDDLATVILASRREPALSGSAQKTETLDHRSGRPATGSVECVYIDNDQYFGHDQAIGKSDNPQWKAYKKTMKIVALSAESYLSSLQDASTHASMGMQSIPVFAVADVSFWVLRDFGTALMRREQKDQSASGAFNEVLERHGAKHKRSLKTLVAAIDSYMRRYGIWSGSASAGSSSPQRGHHSASSGGDHGSSDSTSLMSFLLYSKVDDRFDLITLSCSKSGYRTANNPKKR